MSKKSSRLELVEHELAPGVFDPSSLSPFEENDAIVKRAPGNLGYFVNLDAGASYEGVYWQADTSDIDRSRKDLVSYVLSGSREADVAKSLDLESIDRLRKTVSGHGVGLTALETVLDAVNEVDHQKRRSQVLKLGASIVERLHYYHLLLDSSPAEPDGYEIIGKFAHLRGLALDEEGKGMPVVFGKSGTLGTLPSFWPTSLYWGMDNEPRATR